MVYPHTKRVTWRHIVTFLNNDTYSVDQQIFWSYGPQRFTIIFEKLDTRPVPIVMINLKSVFISLLNWCFMFLKSLYLSRFSTMMLHEFVSFMPCQTHPAQQVNHLNNTRCKVPSSSASPLLLLLLLLLLIIIIIIPFHSNIHSNLLSWLPLIKYNYTWVYYKRMQEIELRWFSYKGFLCNYILLESVANGGL